jgi:alpha-tubulin suppressor-like RCC1 family protein
MKCWGRNDYSQLGDGTTTNSNVPITVSSIAQPISVSSLFDGSCVTINGGTAVCFGRNHQRQLGDGTTTHRTTPSNILTGPGANLTNVKTLFTGIYHGCALLTDNTVKCWGRNAEGQLGNGVTSTTGYAVSPTVISNNVIWVGTGGYSTYFLLSTNDVYSTGYSSDGQSGSGYYINQSTPQSFGLNSVIAISNGSFGMNGCILLSGNTLKCFGRNGYGQLGIGSFLYTPSVVPGLSNVTKIAANVSNATTCAVLNDTTAKCWGVNSYYTLSDGTTTTRTSPAVVKTNDGAGNLSTLSNITSVSTNPYNTCFLLSDKTVHCSGVKTYGGIGDGQNTDRTTAWDTMAVGQSTTIINNANTLTTSGEGATCALLDDQTVKCWGRDNSGTQGRGSNTSSRTTPSNVKTDAATNLTSVTSIALGLYHSCAIASGNVYCWGTNYFGEIGVSTSTSAQYYATQVAGISNAQSIYAGYYNTCVIKTDNTVSCFGNNTNGQFGNGGTTHSTTAIDNIGGFTTALKVGVGLYGICIVLTNGSVYCAGNDGAGLMGTGERGDDRTSFTQVSGISTATDIVQGNNHACALLSDQTVTCWGRDFGGVLGRGTVDQAYPQTVLNYP